MDRGQYFAPDGPTGVAVEVRSLDGLHDPAAGPPSNISISVEVPDVDAVFDALKAGRVRIARGLVDEPWGHRSFGLDDPDGLRIWYLQTITPDD